MGNWLQLLVIGCLLAASPRPATGQVNTLPSDAALRAEGIERSQAYSLNAELSDRIGARLTGSTELAEAQVWAMAKLKAFGATNVHLEDGGAFGLGWRQHLATLNIVAPFDAPLTVLAVPWSASSHGSVTADVVVARLQSTADFARYRGKLRDKILFLGNAPPASLPFKPFAVRLSDEDLRSGAAIDDLKHYYAHRPARLAARAANARFERELGAFLTQEHVRAVVLTSGPSPNGTAAGLIRTDTFNVPGGRPWRVDERVDFPILRTSAEGFGRVERMVDKGAQVRATYNVDVSFSPEPQRISNVVADLPGSDPEVAGQYVLLGAHLDSWVGGTGAVDNGSGVAMMLEAFRILHAADVPLRRTVRVVLYGGEEQGLLGSAAYAKAHLGTIQCSASVDKHDAADKIGREPAASLSPGPDYNRLSAAFNVDSGSGRLRAALTGGGNPALAAMLRDWIRPLADIGMIAVYDQAGWPADQTSFTDLGLPGIDFVQDPLDYDSRAHHTNIDTTERLSAADLAQGSVVLATLAARVANAESLLPRAMPHGCR